MLSETRVCQSCAMPMPADDVLGANKDGTLNADYCHYCYKDGAFVSDETMEQMIESCIKFALEDNVYPDADTARAEMMKFYPTLKRWKTA